MTLRVSHDPHDTLNVLVLLDKHTAKLNDTGDGSFAVSGTQVDVYTGRTRRSPGNRLKGQQESACERAEPPPAGQRLAQGPTGARCHKPSPRESVPVVRTLVVVALVIGEALNAAHHGRQQVTIGVEVRETVPAIGTAR